MTAIKPVSHSEDLVMTEGDPLKKA